MAAPATNILQPPVIPERIGKYPIINEVGRGSTGTVYLSHDSYYGRDVAIKLYNMDTGGDDERARVTRKMFLSEAHMVGMLHHPNILPIYDAGEENGHCYIVTEHVHGARTLATYCRPDNLLRVDDVVEIMFKCVKAMHYAHTRGVIHRDIKPSNIMLTQLHVARAGAEPRALKPLGHLFPRRGDVRTADRNAPVPRRQSCQAAAP